MKILNKLLFVALLCTFMWSCKKQGINSSSPENFSRIASNTANVQTYNFSAPIKLTGQNNIVIQGDSINGGSLACISLINCTHVHIKNCKLQNSTNQGIYLTGCSDVLIDTNLIKNVQTAVYVTACPLGQIRIMGNQVQNVVGPYPRGQFVQFNNVGGPYNRIEFNRVENISGSSNPEDIVSIYKCKFPDNDPLYVLGNWFRGGGPSTTGAGITLGDQGGANQIAQNNICVGTGADGLQIAGGINMTLKNNTVYSSAQPYSHVGIGCGNYSQDTISNWTVSNNTAFWTSGNPNDQIIQNGVKTTSREMDYSYSSTLGFTPTGWSTNVVNTSLNAQILPVVLITMK